MLSPVATTVATVPEKFPAIVPNDPALVVHVGASDTVSKALELLPALPSLFSTLIKYVPSVGKVKFAVIDVALVYVTVFAAVIDPLEPIASTCGMDTKFCPVITTFVAVLGIAEGLIEDTTGFTSAAEDAIVNVSLEGNGFPWHFDTNNYTVTLAIQNATEGGEFEYAPMIRQKNENFAEVSKVLKNQSNLVKSINLQPGDLQLFKGRYSLHRVAPLKGKVPRYVAILSYVEEKNMVGSVERTKQLYGRVLQIHYEKAGKRADNFID